MNREHAIELKRGSALFVYANTKFKITSRSELNIWKATVNENFFTKASQLHKE
jgi:hypothetical protein